MQEQKASLKSRIRLVEIVDSPTGPTGNRPSPHWKVILAFKDDFDVTILQGTYYFPKSEWKDDGLLPVARSRFHHLCKKIGEDTTEWALDKESFEALKRQKAKPPSASPDVNS